MQRRPDIFIAGLNEIDGFQGPLGGRDGPFDGPVRTVPGWASASKRIAMLRYVEFNHVVDGRIVETAMFCDILHLMMQAGQNPLPPQTGAMLVQPGPMTHTGLCYEPQDPARARPRSRRSTRCSPTPSPRIWGSTRLPG
jgi:hypothetical protein